MPQGISHSGSASDKGALGVAYAVHQEREPIPTADFDATVPTVTASVTLGDVVGGISSASMALTRRRTVSAYTKYIGGLDGNK